MRRIVVLLSVMALMSVVAAGVAWAVVQNGTNGPDTLRGTNRFDNQNGKGGNDKLYGRGEPTRSSVGRVATLSKAIRTPALQAGPTLRSSTVARATTFSRAGPGKMEVMAAPATTT
jgi:hypothetical protein